MNPSFIVFQSQSIWNKNVNIEPNYNRNWQRLNGGSVSRVSVYNVGDLGSIPGLGRIPGGGNGNPLQYSCLENPTDGGAWCPWGCKESDTTEQLHFHFHHIFIHPSVNGYFGCFHVLAIVNGPSVNFRVHVSFRTLFFSRHISGSVIARPGTHFLFSPISCDFHSLCYHILSSGSGKAPDFTEFTFSDGTIYI